MKILITGGAGYAGCVLVPQLLDAGYEVRVLDNLMYGGDGLLPFFHNPNFEFIEGDVANKYCVMEAAEECEAIIHLAAIVGYPACREHPDLARSAHVDGVLSVKQAALPTIFASTQSVYGIVEEDICTEETPLKPLSEYAKDKRWDENCFLGMDDFVILRFPTAFGLSSRMRLDLLVNDFVYKAITDGYIAVYQPQMMRAFIHVHDMARAYLFTLRHFHEMAGQVYNVGSDEMNFTKRELAEAVRAETGCEIFYEDFDTDLDKRNYRVSCAKIAEFGYETTLTLQDGIEELASGLRVLDVKGKYANA